MDIIDLKLDELEMYENNPRLNKEAVRHVADSIEAYGFKVPIVIDKNYVIVTGHTRYLASKELGLETVPCIIADDLTEQQVNEFRLVDNKVSEYAQWDMSKLEEELKQVGDLSEYGFADLNEVKDEFESEVLKNDDFFYFEKDEIIQDIVDNFKSYESIEEYVSLIMDVPKAKYEFNRLCQGYQSGYNISLLFNPHRLEVSTKQSKLSIFEAIQTSDKYRLAFAKYIVNIQNKVTTNSEYYKFIGIGSGGVQYVNEFPPYLARDLYKKYCKDGYKILDPCHGWGGRTIGLASTGLKDIEYIGSDPSVKTYQGLLKIKEFLKLDDSFQYFNLPFEEMTLEKDYFDFCFTSPPYFDTEEYSDDKGQSYLENDTYEDWKVNFLHVMLDKILYSLKPEAKCLLNVGKVRYPIDDDIIEYMNQKGIAVERIQDFKIGGSGLGARTDEDGQGEPFLIFEKPKGVE